MADNNSVEFTVRIKDEGLDKLAGNLGNVEQKVDALGSSSTTASQGVQKLHLGTQTAGRFYEKAGFRVDHRLVRNLRVRQKDGQAVMSDLVMLSLDF